MFQEQLADMLGAGRTFVTHAVNRLRQERTIATQRGVIAAKDQQRLRDTACGCTMAIENHFDVVLDSIHPIE